MAHRESGYRAFMIRLWYVDDVEEAVWRVSLEDVHTGERRGFADLPAFFAFLEENTAAVDGMEETPSGENALDSTSYLQEDLA